MKKGFISYSFIILVCLLYAFDRNGAAFTVLLAALIHELGHICMILVCKGKINKITLIGAGGCVFYTPFCLSCGMEAAVCAMGPAFSAAAAVIAEALGYHDFSCASMGLCVLNLLPSYPLDGGGILKSLLEPSLAERVLNITSSVCALSLCVLGVFLMRNNQNYSLFACGLTIFICLIRKNSIK